MHPDLQLVTTLVTAGLPTLTVLVSLLINNHRLSDLQRSSDRRFDELRSEMNRGFDEQWDLLPADLFRVEQVLDARLKHLEEHS